MSKKNVTTKANEVVEEQNQAEVKETETTAVAKKLTFAERRAIRKAEIEKDKNANPDNYRFGARVKRALPAIGAAVVGFGLGFLTNAFCKEGDEGCESTVNYVNMNDEDL